MTAKEAMEEIWGLLCPDCSPTNYKFMIEDIRKRLFAKVEAN